MVFCLTVFISLNFRFVLSSLIDPRHSLAPFLFLMCLERKDLLLVFMPILSHLKIFSGLSYCILSLKSWQFVFLSVFFVLKTTHGSASISDNISLKVSCSFTLFLSVKLCLQNFSSVRTVSLVLSWVTTVLLLLSIC